MWPIWIGAVVSVIGALVSWINAQVARKSADSINRRRHALDALDKSAATFQQAYGEFLASWPDTMHRDPLGPMLFKAEALLAHPLCTKELEATIDEILNMVVHTVAEKKNIGDEVNVLMAAMRASVRAVNADVETRRLKLIS